MPHSKDIIPKEYFAQIYDSVTNNAFFTPVSRSLIEDQYNQAIPVDIQIRLSQIPKREVGQEEHVMTESEFVNTADLTSK